MFDNKTIGERFSDLRKSKKDNRGKDMPIIQLAQELSNKKHIKDYEVDVIRQEIGKVENKGKFPQLFLIKGYCEYFKVTSDYLLGIRDTKPVDENIAMIAKVTGLSNDAIEMLKLFIDKSKKYYPLNKRCTEMLNLVLSDFYNAIQKAGGNNGIYFGNIFFSMWEYIHAKNTVTYKVNDETGELEHKTYINIAIDDDLDVACNKELNGFSFSHNVSLEDATKSRTQKDILQKLNELETSILSNKKEQCK